MQKSYLEKELKKVVTQLVNLYKPKKIILFGSLARGDANPHDADLLIIKDGIPHLGTERIRQVNSLFRHTISVDAIVYKTDEFARLAKIDPFIKQVIAEGKVLYE